MSLLPSIFKMSGISFATVAFRGAPHAELKAGRPSHHANDAAATHLTNPWPSFRSLPLPALPNGNASSPSIGTDDDLISSWVALGPPPIPEKFKATWLGHACFLVELPTPSGAARGPRILFNPVFSHRCGPTSCLGPGRIMPPACPVQQLPEVDAIVISHCHYDHLDIPTIKFVIFPPPSPLPSPP
ncbi:hypothetical protein M422DRAFT_257680 [Sphaerobolus stellatus SS14]|uniref:Metallo-beta-lactamase domain-containing protein n=1 Tax=Sphaerobolus stellatus (strain SS14) TaxID=990650 RepID=A0A0C9U962_SPHS4|nr:hypothetical protein M422DRAFT_257680 [Sphaerobolus stellatus SS14]